MEIRGKIIVALPEMSGVSKSGNNWKKREYVLETQETYPKKVHFDLFGERADQYPLNVGDDVTLSFDIESREYNGRWFTSIRGWKVEKATNAQPNQFDNGAGAFNGANLTPPPPVFDNTSAGGANEDLPF